MIYSQKPYGFAQEQGTHLSVRWFIISHPKIHHNCCIFSTVCPYSTHDGRKGRFAKGPFHECPFWCVANLSISWAVTLDAVQVEISIMIFNSGSKARKTKQNDSWDQYVILISNTGCDQTETFSVDWLQRNVARHIYLDFPFNRWWENRTWRSSKLQNSWLVKAAQHHCFGKCLSLDYSMFNHFVFQYHWPKMPAKLPLKQIWRFIVHCKVCNNLTRPWPRYL